MQNPPSDDHDRGMAIACLTIYFLVLLLVIFSAAVWVGVPWTR